MDRYVIVTLIAAVVGGLAIQAAISEWIPAQPAIALAALSILVGATSFIIGFAKRVTETMESLRKSGDDS